MIGRDHARVFSRCVVAVILVSFFLISVSGAAAAFKNIKVGDQALPVELEDLAGDTHSFSSLKDSKAVLVFFWATWSQRSLKELEDLKKIQEMYEEKGLRILAVNVENQNLDSEDRRQISSIVEKLGLTFPIVLDKGLKTYSSWGVIATPTTALVDEAGTVVFDLSSYPTRGYMDIEEAVQKALGLYVEEEVTADSKPAYVPDKNSMLHFGLGKRLLQKGFVSKALPELEQAVVADTRYPDPLIYLGLARIKDGNSEGAKEAVDKALALDSERSEARLLSAHLLLEEQKLDEALSLLQSSETVPEEETSVKDEEAPSSEETSAPEEASAPEVASAEKTDETKAETAEESAANTPDSTDEKSKETATDEKMVSGVDLASVIALKEEGKTDEAVKALETYISSELKTFDIQLVKKPKLSAMEKMQMMMKGKGPKQ